MPTGWFHGVSFFPLALPTFFVWHPHFACVFQRLGNNREIHHATNSDFAWNGTTNKHILCNLVSYRGVEEQRRHREERGWGEKNLRICLFFFTFFSFSFSFFF